MIAVRRSDRALSLLVAVIAAEVWIVAPLIETGSLNRHVGDVAFILLLAAGALAISRRLKRTRVFAAVAVVVAAIRIANYWLPDESLRALDASLSLAALALLAWIIFAQTFRDATFTIHELLGAVAGYLLLGMMFMQAYRLVAMHADGAFVLLGNAANYDQIVGSLLYYSMVTLTTMGYGDIAPVHPVARSLATLEGMIGILYPAVLVARIVTMQMESERRDRADRGET